MSNHKKLNSIDGAIVTGKQSDLEKISCCVELCRAGAKYVDLIGSLRLIGDTNDTEEQDAKILKQNGDI